MPRTYTLGVKHAFSVVLGCMTLWVALAGCRAGNAAAPIAAPALAPPDFSLSVTLMGTSGTGQYQPAWYLLDPGGTLRVATGTRTAASPVPPIVRVLPSQEVQAIYASAHESGVLTPRDGYVRVSDLFVPVESAEPIAIVSTSVSGRRISYILPRPESAGTDGSSRFGEVLSTLRASAWLPTGDRP